MCKILILTSHKPSERVELITSAWTYFDKSGERDGFGAVWITRNGKLAHVRSRTPSLACDKAPWLDTFISGERLHQDSDGGFLLIHGRKATCDVCLENTHPMLSEAGSALIHNGVVTSDRYKNVTTTCDSELLLRAMESDYVDGLADISGYFAFGMIQPANKGHVLHVAKDDRASLYSGRSGKGWVFGTTEAACSIAGCETALKMRENSLVTFTNATDGKMVALKKAEPKVIKAYSPSDWPKSYRSERELFRYLDDTMVADRAD